MDIDVKKYLTEDEMHDIAVAAYRDMVYNYIGSGEKALATILRVAANSAYNECQERFDEIIKSKENSLVEYIREKTKEILNDKGSLKYILFREPDSWHRESLAYKLMNDAVIENKELIRNNVQRAINDFDYKKEVADQLSSYFDEAVDAVSNAFYEMGKIFRKTNDEAWIINR